MIDCALFIHACGTIYVVTGEKCISRAKSLVLEFDYGGTVYVLSHSHEPGAVSFLDPATRREVFRPLRPGE